MTGTNGVAYTPGGLAWGNQWGTLRFVTNAAMIASVYAQNVQSASIQGPPLPSYSMCPLHMQAVLCKQAYYNMLLSQNALNSFFTLSCLSAVQSLVQLK